MSADRATAGLNYKPAKYAAFNLMIARWQTRFPAPSPVRYVTMGGTELYDIANFCWARHEETESVCSFEQDMQRYKLAVRTAERFRKSGIEVEVVRGDIFDYRRSASTPHVFFVDLEGTCNGAAYINAFRGWFENSVLDQGDLLLVTSYLGRRTPSIIDLYDAEFRIMGLQDEEDRVAAYKALHPAFVIYRALYGASALQTLRTTMVGHAKYFGTSPMGLYGFAFEPGITSFRQFVRGVPTFDLVTRTWTFPG